MERIRQLKFARNLRANQTSAELKLWYQLRRRGLGGYRFNRQFAVGPFVVDFACREKALVVEVDGATHGETHEVSYDEKRTAFLMSQGFRIYRVGNNDVYENLDGVLDGILETWRVPFSAGELAAFRNMLRAGAIEPSS